MKIFGITKKPSFCWSFLSFREVDKWVFIPYLSSVAHTVFLSVSEWLPSFLWEPNHGLTFHILDSTLKVDGLLHTWSNLVTLSALTANSAHSSALVHVDSKPWSPEPFTRCQNCNWIWRLVAPVFFFLQKLKYRQKGQGTHADNGRNCTLIQIYSCWANLLHSLISLSEYYLFFSM